MSYFSSDFIDFFEDLSKNNNKEWFHANKGRYEKSIKQPFEFFVGDLIKEIQQHDPSLQVEAKDCILRINKDIRFTKDKAPYNLHYTGYISNGGKKDKTSPGLFLRFSLEGLYIMAGCYAPEKDQLNAIRNTIAVKHAEFKEIVSDASFQNAFGSVQGDKNKKIPVEFQEAFEKEPLIANKQFYILASAPSELITASTLLEEIMKYWKITRPFNDFLKQALQTNQKTLEYGI